MTFWWGGDREGLTPLQFLNIPSMQIGVFDSGYGGLTILRQIRNALPQYDYLYLGDNARAPYGSRSFDIVYDFTLQAVRELFDRGCPLVILACNTASAKALRTIQENDLPKIDPSRRVLGVIRPTAEALGDTSITKHVGVLATSGTTKSHSYSMETLKLFPEMVITEQACPMWVPLVECNEAFSPGADYFVKKYIDEILAADPMIDTLVLGCTHYPLLYHKIRQFTPAHIQILPQGELVAKSLENYLQRHPEIEQRCSRGNSVEYLTTENTEKFDSLASLFMGDKVTSVRISLN